jgi:hypothetical protein
MNFLSKLLQGISFLPSIVSAVEGLFGSKSGTQKKDAALGFISAALNLGEAITDKQVVDADRFQEGLSKVIDGVVQCLNASVWAKKTVASN